MAITRATAKKNRQLGMAFGTAAHRLRTDIMWTFIQATGAKCCRCGKEMTREAFTIDHLDDWLDSANPVERFFDIANIGFSHPTCNYSAARRPYLRTPEEDSDDGPYDRRRLAEIRERKRNEENE